MSLLAPLLAADPAAPRLTVYDETAGTRMEFSGMTLDNWANKIANMLVEEFELDSPALNPRIVVDVPVSWQAAVLPIGIYSAGLVPEIDTAHNADPGTASEGAPGAADTRLVFTTAWRAALWADAGDVVAVSDDPFGRGIVESGGQLPHGAVDFGPTVRFYGDQYYGETPDLAAWQAPGAAAERLLVPAWTNRAEFDASVMAPLAAGGSVVAVAGMASTDRLSHIARTEKVTRALM